VKGKRNCRHCFHCCSVAYGDLASHQLRPPRLSAGRPSLSTGKFSLKGKGKVFIVLLAPPPPHTDRSLRRVRIVLKRRKVRCAGAPVRAKQKPLPRNLDSVTSHPPFQRTAAPPPRSQAALGGSSPLAIISKILVQSLPRLALGEPIAFGSARLIIFCF